MEYVIAECSKSVCLGRLGENKATTIKFPATKELLEEFPNASISLINKRNGDPAAYPVDPAFLSMEDDVLCWLIQSGDLVKYGNGQCELIAYEDDKIDKSVIYTTFVDTALDGSGDPPEPWESWVQRLIEAAQKAEEASSNYPRISDNGTWEIWDVENEEWIDTEIPATGDDGYSPTVTVTQITGGHRITITDEAGDHSFDVMDGEKGDDGISPDVNVTDISGGHRVTITDATGSHSFDVLDGDDGYSPIVSVSTITGGHRVTIADASGSHSFDVMDGDTGATPSFSIGTVTTGEPGTPAVVTITGTAENPVLNFTIPKGDTGATPTIPVTDVQINGTSILNNGVANIPQASNNDSGVGKADGTYGISVASNGFFNIVRASDSQLKAGASLYRPIVPANQDTSVFYALAKLVGADMAQSSNAIGTYTEAALAGIQRLFGLIAMLAPDETDSTADHEYVSGQVFCYNGKLYKATDAISIGATITPDGNCEIATIADVFVKFTDIATATTYGLVRVASQVADIKAGNSNSKAVVTNHQHESVFYALAKLAGVDLASSNTPVGTYTAEAKAAILAMLGAVGKTDIAGSTGENKGIAYFNGNYGISVNSETGGVYVSKPSDDVVKAGANDYKPIVPSVQHKSVYYALAKLAGVDLANGSDTVGVYPQNAKTAIQAMLGIDADIPLVETVSGSTPSITGLPNVRYECGTVSSLSITPPASGAMVVLFHSGATPAVLTVPNTVKFPEWFDYTNLSADTTYELVITNGTFCGVMSWAD